MKKFFVSLVFALPFLVFSCVSGGGAVPARYAAGVYEGRGEGYLGIIELRVTVSSGAITQIELVEHEETPGIGSIAMEELGDAIIDANSTDVDAVTGASGSSRGFIDAVEDALSQARL